MRIRPGLRSALLQEFRWVSENLSNRSGAPIDPFDSRLDFSGCLLLGATILDKEKETKAPSEQTPDTSEAEPQKQIDPPTPKFVKAKKRKAILWTIVGIGAVGVLTLGTIAFLGTNFGSFTIKLEKDPDASLEMGTVLALTGRGTGLEKPSSYLNAEGITSTAAIAADNLPKASILDADITTDNYDEVMDAKKQAAAKTAQVGTADSSSGDAKEGVYFNYTFYLRNISTEEVSYSIKMDATSVTEPSNLYDASGNLTSVPLEKFIRIRVYENLYLDGLPATHSHVTYAYPATTSGTPLPEYVSDPGSTNPESRAVCTNFSDWQSSLFTVFSYEGKSLPGEGVVRYSVLMWFEGFDPDTENVQMPQDGSLAFGIDITGTKKRASQDSSASI